MDGVRGDLSPPCYDGVNPKGLPSDSASPAQAGGKILGLVAPFTGIAVSSPVAESADPSGKDSLVRMGPACHSIASQSGNQPDSQSEAHTALSAADGLCEPLDRQKSKRIWRSKFESDPSCVAARAPSHTAHPHSAFQFQLASSQCPFSTGEPPEAVTPERHSAFLRPELLDSLDLDSESDTVKDRGRGTVPSKPRKERTVFKFNSDTTLRLHDRSIRDRLQTADWNRLYRDKTGVYRPCILISQPQRDKVRLAFRCDIAEIDERVREDRTFLQRVNLDTVGQVKQSNRLKLFTLTLVDTEADWTESAPLLLQPGKQTVAPLMSIPEGRRLSNETDKSDSVNTKRDWCPTGNSVCRLLHREDIGSRWVEIVAARLRKLKKRSGVRDRARKKKAGDAERIWLTSRMAAIKKASTESTNVRELHEQAQAAKAHQRFEPMRAERDRGALKGIQKVTVCGLETERELHQPGRKYFKPPTELNSNIPVTLYYCAALSVLHAIFFLSEHVPEVRDLVTSHYGEMILVILTVAAAIYGCKLYNGSIIASLLLFAWHCIGSTSGAASGGGPLYWLSLLLPQGAVTSIVGTAITIATLVLVEKPARATASKTRQVAAAVSNSRIAANRDKETAKLFNSTYVEIELIDDPGVIIRVLLDSGAATSVMSSRQLKHIWHKLKRKYTGKKVESYLSGRRVSRSRIGHYRPQVQVPGV